ncbi:MAG: alpha/beta fold hydrolase [Planctomycetes bacterium]|nr:alpha/beta fold hydrolase [Planctomycetota bacterium]
MSRRSSFSKVLVCFIGLAFGYVPAHARQEATTMPSARSEAKLKLETTVDEGTGHRTSTGTYTVYENRETQSGRTIDLNIVILHATGENPKSDPIFEMAGGPGMDITIIADRARNHPQRDQRDIVLVTQRGTGGSMPLHCELLGTDDNVQGYLTGVWDLEVYERCRDELSQRADLTQYSTSIAADDLNEIRQALGYDRINLRGGSYGTRASLVYMRRHPETVRTAVLSGVAPIAFTNPLYHAVEAQTALDLIFAECAADPDCHEAYGDLAVKFLHIRQRLEAQALEVSVQLPFMNEPQTITLSWQSFAGAFRTLMYFDSRRIPFLVNSAFEGDYKTFAEAGIMSNRSIQNILAFGMLLCVTCAEDLDRITEAMIVEATKDTFFGDYRVRAQKAICDIWPRSVLPENYGEDVSVDVPTLLLSGTFDPVTGPRWGEQAASSLPNGLHVIAPGSHGVGGPCIDSIIEAFVEKGTIEGIDTSCVESMDLGPFVLSEDEEEEEETE